jgi:small GTP-binding protein
LSYPDTHVFLVCFSIAQFTSFENVKSKWVTEIRHHCPNAKIVLVGTKSDVRQDSNFKGPSVSRKEGEKLAKEIGASAYLEASALKREGLKEIFEEVARQGLKVLGE